MATPHAERTQHKAMLDSAGDAHDDRHSDPHAHADGGTRRRPRRQEHERGMVAWRRPGRQLRGERERGRGAGPERDPALPDREPGTTLHERSGLTVSAEREARTRNVDDDRRRAGVRDSDRAVPTALDRDVRRRRGYSHRGPRRARVRGSRHERGGDGHGGSRDHRPITVKVTVAV